MGTKRKKKEKGKGCGWTTNRRVVGETLFFLVDQIMFVFVHHCHSQEQLLRNVRKKGRNVSEWKL